MVVLFKGVLVLLAGLLGCFLVGQVFRNVRRLDRRVAEFKAEQQALEERGRTPHPYVALAELYAEEATRPDDKIDDKISYKIDDKIDDKISYKIGRKIRRKGG